jgi:chloramphenicol O-acetyltransferase
MAVYKVILRCPFRKTQTLKKIYESDAKFENYGKSYAEGAVFRSDVEVYKMVDEKYELQYQFFMPRTNVEIEKYVLDNKMYPDEAKWRIIDLNEQKNYFRKVFNIELT